MSSMSKKTNGEPRRPSIVTPPPNHVQWLDPEPLPGSANHPNYYDTSPVLAASGDTLYFASERPGGEGGFVQQLRRHFAGELAEPAQSVDPSHVIGRSAVRLEETR